jgi:hypothetical protein
MRTDHFIGFKRKNRETLGKDRKIFCKGTPRETGSRNPENDRHNQIIQEKPEKMPSTKEPNRRKFSTYYTELPSLLPPASASPVLAFSASNFLVSALPFCVLFSKCAAFCAFSASQNYSK